MIKNIKNKYVRRAVWLGYIIPALAASVVLGAGLGACEFTGEILKAAKQAW